MVLTSADDIDVVAEARDGREAVETARSTAVDVALPDIQMPGRDGLTAPAEIGRTARRVRVLIPTTVGERENVLRAPGHGGAGFLLKDSAPQELIHAVRAAAAGHACLSPAATRHVVDALASPAAAARGEEARRRLSALTERELEAPALLGEGLSHAGAGARLHMSGATVKTYVSRTLTEPDCDNRVQAALLARDAGLEPAGG
ncbi:response regulator [Streptomyces sp. NPDC096105]|uniref:response regulator n=1 Tax=Streptomyces sp. NPDC096105 TaxID=3366074 RepID=UPI0038221F30